jgi:hypothetical protein
MSHIHWVSQTRNPRIRWGSARPRHDGSPTDTQADTPSRSPPQGIADHCLTSRRRRCAEKWSLSRYCCANCILETKTKVGSTAAKAPALRTNPKIGESPQRTQTTHPPIPPANSLPSTPSRTRLRYHNGQSQGK